jgi:hypothetical protein
MNRILIRPVRRLFTRRQQWTFEIRAANGERIDPRDTYNNWRDISDFWLEFILNQPAEIVLYGLDGEVAERATVRE